MTILYARPKHAPAPDGGSSLAITVKPEKWRCYSYGFFWSMCFSAWAITRKWVTPMIEGGALDEPPERLGCGPFNRESEEFGLEYGDGFTLHESHVELVCAQWDYTPAREAIALYFPLFEYSLVIYLLLDFVNTKLSYKRGELPEWYWNLTCVVSPITVFLCLTFRMIFVFIAYEQPRGHVLAYLGLVIALVIVAIMNVMYIVLTGQEYSSVDISPEKVTMLAKHYLILNYAISCVKIYATLYIVIHPDVVAPLGLVLGKFIDLIWVVLNGVLPFIIAYIRMINEDPFVIDIGVPKHNYKGDEGGTTETTSLIDEVGKEMTPTKPALPPVAPAIPVVAPKPAKPTPAPSTPAEPAAPEPAAPEPAAPEPAASEPAAAESPSASVATTPPPKDPYIIQGQQNLDGIKGNQQMNDSLARIYTEKGHKAAEALLFDGSWISDIYLPSGCPEGSKLTIRCNSTWNVNIHNLKPYSKTVATKQRLVVVVVGGVWTIQEWVDEKGPYIVKGQENLNRFKGTGDNYFLIVAGGRVVLHSADLEECKKYLMTNYGHGASRPSRMIVDVSGGKVHEDPHTVGGQNQGGGMGAGFNKWWQGWPDIHSMTAVAKTYMNTHKLGGPPKNDNLLHIFNPKDYKDCEIHTWDGSWIPEIYLPDAKGILEKSTLTVKCNSTWAVKVHYPGKWTKTVASKQQLILTVKNKGWVFKTA